MSFRYSTEKCLKNTVPFIYIIVILLAHNFFLKNVYKGYSCWLSILPVLKKWLFCLVCMEQNHGNVKYPQRNLGGTTIPSNVVLIINDQ